jgi:prepilin-type N-terminal cleavage/methylation domain-containing protein
MATVAPEGRPIFGPSLGRHLWEFATMNRSPRFASWSCRGARVGRAFTLMELLVTIAIILLLVALTLPALRQAKRASMLAVCSSNLHQINQAYAGYKQDDATNTSVSKLQAGAWPVLLGEYVNNEFGVFVCPEDDSPASAGIFNKFYAALNSVTSPSRLYDMQNGPLQRRLSKTQYQQLVGQYGNGDGGWWPYFAPGGGYEQDGGYVDDGSGEYWLLTEDIVGGDGGPAGDKDFNDAQVHVVTQPDGTALVWALKYSGNTFWMLWGDDLQNIFSDFPNNGRLENNSPIGPVALTGGKASYGMNQYVSKLGTQQKVLMIDYKRPAVQPDPAVGGDDWDADFRDAHGRLTFARHLGYKSNVLYPDGTVRQQDPEDLNPAVQEVRERWWLP